MEFLKWFSAVCLIIGTGLTAFVITPINTVFFFIGSIGWTTIGLIWREYSLVTVNGICAVLYVLGWNFPEMFDKEFLSAVFSR